MIARKTTTSIIGCAIYVLLNILGGFANIDDRSNLINSDRGFPPKLATVTKRFHRAYHVRPIGH